MIRTRVMIAVLIGCAFAQSSLKLRADVDSKTDASEAVDIQLTDVSRETGVTFRHTDGSSGRYYIVETVSAGLASFDYDNDGDLDLYFLNGKHLPGDESTTPATNALYRNDGGWRFTDVSASAHVADEGHGLGVAVGDYDNDGDADFYVNNFGPNVLYRNNGDGTFTDVTSAAGVGNGDRVGAGVAFVDYDVDGDLDLYVANYVKFSFTESVNRKLKGRGVYPGPLDFAPDPDTLYRNNGDGTFTDVSSEAGISAHAAAGMGLVCADYDQDGDPDILVGNDSMANFLFRNEGNGTFKEIGLLSGFAYDLTGKAQGTMGVDCGDFDNDGRLDIFTTAYQGERSAFYRNLGKGRFADVSLTTGAGNGTVPQVKWGNAFADFDNDGDLDLFIACGHLHDQVGQLDDSTKYEATNVVMLNEQGKRFRPLPTWGTGQLDAKSSRGVVVDDLDNDGDLDVVISNSRREPTLLRNDSPSRHHWLQIRLHGTRSNRDAVGTQVELRVGDHRQLAEVHSGRGYQSHFGTRLHFGLRDRQRIDELQIRWNSGKRQTLRDLPVNQVIDVTEPND